MSGKKWYYSKTFILNIIAIFAFLMQSSFGFVIEPEQQALILGAINMVVRLFTGKPIEGLEVLFLKDSQKGYTTPLKMVVVMLMSLLFFACGSIIKISGSYTTKDGKTVGGAITVAKKAGGGEMYYTDENGTTYACGVKVVDSSSDNESKEIALSCPIVDKNNKK